MKILLTIAERAAAEGLPFLVIGGNAVVVYGYGRKTMDLDLLVCEDDRRAWDALVTNLGYRAHQIARVFHMYNPVGGGLPPIDLMLVDSGTFLKLSAAPHTGVLEDQPVTVPALPHLLALKLHALRHGHPDRQIRDFGDVVELVRRHKVNLASAEYQEILSRYADDVTRRKLSEALPGSFGSEPSGI